MFNNPQTYNELLHKLAEIFNLNRVLFLEFSVINPDELIVKYEYVTNKKNSSVNNLVFPQICIDEFSNLIHNLKMMVINDVSDCFQEHTNVFLKKYKIKSLLAVPLVKYNKETKIWGFIVLCAEKARIWTKEEINLINIISESVVSVIWELSKFIEIEELRNAFILTLTHNFQVPLRGEQKALEYLKSVELGKYKEIVEALLQNNKNIITMLNKFIDVYNYESGKKKPDLDNYEIYDILNNSVKTFEDYAVSKFVKIQLNKNETPLFVKVDKEEITKIFDTIITNAIENSPEGEVVEIKYYKKDNQVIISIHNNGKVIPEEIQDIIFSRYAMALAIERKIYPDIGHILSKRIIEAHNGSIWFETKLQEGTTFYISLPRGSMPKRKNN